MSHCTKFKFQYTDLNCIEKAFSDLQLSYKWAKVRTYENLKWRADEYPTFRSDSLTRDALVSKRRGFNYLALSQ